MAPICGWSRAAATPAIDPNGGAWVGCCAANKLAARYTRRLYNDETLCNRKRNELCWVLAIYAGSAVGGSSAYSPWAKPIAPDEAVVDEGEDIYEGPVPQIPGETVRSSWTGALGGAPLAYEAIPGVDEVTVESLQQLRRAPANAPEFLLAGDPIDVRYRPRRRQDGRQRGGADLGF